MRGRLWSPEVAEHVGKTISYSQIVSGHSSSYVWTPLGTHKHTAGEDIREKNMDHNKKEKTTGDFLCCIKCFLVGPNMGVKWVYLRICECVPHTQIYLCLQFWPALFCAIKH